MCCFHSRENLPTDLRTPSLQRYRPAPSVRFGALFRSRIYSLGRPRPMPASWTRLAVLPRMHYCSMYWLLVLVALTIPTVNLQSLPDACLTRACRAEGADFAFPCRSRGDNSVKVVFNTFESAANGANLPTENGTLYPTPLTADQTGYYMCFDESQSLTISCTFLNVTTTLGEQLECYRHLTPKPQQHLQQEKYTWVGDTLDLDCNATSDGKPMSH